MSDPLNHLSDLPEPPALPDDVKALLDAASGGAPPPPVGAEAAVLAKVAATVGAPTLVAAAAPVAITLSKPVVVAVLALVVAGGGVVVATRAAPPTPAHPAAVPAAVPAVVTTTPVAPAVPSPAVPSPAVPSPAVPSPVVSSPTVSSAVSSPAVPILVEPARIGGPDADERAGPAPGALAPARAKVAPEVEPEAEPEVEPKVEPEAGLGESALLEDARDALARGDGEWALTSLRAHAKRFPRGQLVEERRALTVVAFALQGDEERARAAARAFEREHPTSLFLETVRSAVQAAGAPGERK